MQVEITKEEATFILDKISNASVSVSIGSIITNSVKIDASVTALVDKLKAIAEPEKELKEAEVVSE